MSKTTHDRWLIYGAYGYTGSLVVERAQADGMTPVLSGRNADRLTRMATSSGLESRCVDLADGKALRSALTDIDVVAHCAGPFSATARPMVDACLDTGTSYLDITGELDVLEMVLQQDGRAHDANVTLLPGAGFDVVPTDCLAAQVAAELPSATTLELAFVATGGWSGGTAKTATQGMANADVCRIDGKFSPVPADRRTRTVDFGRGDKQVSTIPWGDIATAYHSTGIGNIFVYSPMPKGAAAASKVFGAAARLPLVGGAVTGLLGAAAGRISGPDEQARAAGSCAVWARASDEAGNEIVRRLSTPNGYSLTADSVVRIVQALLRGDVPAGAHTPSQGMGARFVESLKGVTAH